MERDRELLASMWNECWDKSGWWPAFQPSFADLTPAQAAWKPSPQRHSIWQNLNHILFWREVVLRRLRGESPAQDEIDRRNFEDPPAVTDSAWRDALERLERTHRDFAAAIADPKTPIDRVKFLLPHDAYHVGQVMYLRALQGLAPVV